MFEPAWSTRTVEDDPGAPFFNETAKYVVSGTLEDPTWNNSQVLGAVRRGRHPPLKESLEGVIYISGSGRLVRGLLADGLVDELHLFVYPIALGEGERFFVEGEQHEARTQGARRLRQRRRAPELRPRLRPRAPYAEPVEVRFLDGQGVRRCDPDDVVELFSHDDGFYWIDIPVWEAEAESLLSGLGCHPLVVEGCQQRNYIPTVHGYEDHVFVTTQSPYLGRAGHVHLLELDQIIGHHFLVTVHGPINPVLDITVALVETAGVLARLESGRFRPKTPVELSYAVTSAVARRQRAAISEVSMKLPGLEKEVMSSKLTDPELLLETMFLFRHELITTRTMAAQSHDVWMRLAGINRMADDVDGTYARDIADQFDRVRSLADGESQFLFGIIELYQTKVHTKMTVAMERLAVIAAVTLPVTALASVLGMNVIVNESTQWVSLAIVLVVMATISLMLLTWARRQGWW